MSAPDDEETPPQEAEPPADEEVARAYAAGYEEGARNALREVIQHAARGHTPQEIRMLAEGRLVRLPEEVDSKRRGLLTPPRRTAWGALLRPGPPSAPRPGATPAAPTTANPPLGPGGAMLVREERPGRAVELLRAAVRSFPRTVIVSLHPPDVAGLPPERRIDVLPPGGPSPTGTVPRTGLSELGGRLRGWTEAPGGALVYLDALEYYVAEEGAETTIRFLHWLVAQARGTGSAALVSLNARSLGPTDAARVERAFPTVG